MSDDQFTQLFKYIEGFRENISERLAEAKRDRADIRGAIAGLSAQVRNDLLSL